MGTAEGRDSPSEARSIDPRLRDAIIAIARGLPDSWCVCVEPPYGQITITPRKGYHYAFGAPVALPDGRCDLANTSRAATATRLLRTVR